MRSHRSHHALMANVLHKRQGYWLVNLLIVVAILALVIALFLPSVRRAREAARRTQCRNNLKQLGMALHNYHDKYGVFPPVCTVDERGQPMHSWRTLLLPYLDQQALYEKIDLSKPWNDPSNAEALNTQLFEFLCPSAIHPLTHTTYLAVATEHSVLRRTASLRIDEISDGTSNTILVIDVPMVEAIPWMEPRDADTSLALSFRTATKHPHTGGAHVLFADGAVRFLSQIIKEDVARALLTADGGEEIGNNAF